MAVAISIFVSFALVVLNQSLLVIESLALFMAIQCLLALMSIFIDEEDVRLVAYAPFFVIGYKQLVDLLMVKALFDVLMGRRMSWTRAESYPTYSRSIAFSSLSL